MMLHFQPQHHTVENSRTVIKYYLKYKLRTVTSRQQTIVKTILNGIKTEQTKSLETQYGWFQVKKK